MATPNLSWATEVSCRLPGSPIGQSLPFAPMEVAMPHSGNQAARVIGYASLVGRGRVTKLAGFRRGWGVAMDNSVDLPGYKYFVDPRTGIRPDVHVAFLDLVADETSIIQGSLLEVTEDQLRLLDARERNYFRWRVPGTDHPSATWAYRGTPEARRRCESALELGKLVVARSYIDSVRECFRGLGKQELVRFEATTEDPPCPIVDLKRVDLA